MRDSRQTLVVLCFLAFVVFFGTLEHTLASLTPYKPHAVDFASHSWPDSARYERCKATHRCNRANATYDVRNGSLEFTKRVFRGGLVEPTPLFFDFEDWKVGTMGWELDQSFLSDQVNHTRGPHLNPFDFLPLGDLYLNHSVLIEIDTDSLLFNVTDDGPHVLSYTQPVYYPNGSVAEPADPWLAQGFDARMYSPTPNASAVYTGELVETSGGVEVAVFCFDSVFLGPPVLITVRGRRALGLLSRSSTVLDTALVVPPGTLGGFVGVRNVSEENVTSLWGPGAGATHVTQFTIDATAPAVDPVQSWTIVVDEGQTLRGVWRVGAEDRWTHALPAGAEPTEVARRMSSALELGSVRVSRSDYTSPLNQTGWKYVATFTSSIGAVPQLQTDGTALSGLGASISDVTVLQEANELQGWFTLLWNDTETSVIPVTASALSLRSTLEQAWQPHGLLHAHVERSNSDPGRSTFCRDGKRCSTLSRVRSIVFGFFSGLSP